ncbi:MAG: hypothetical protein S0880_10595 [Actinomycetota bacterium]|nr:hypothetical protein [Actinomycetota bacterium]
MHRPVHDTATRARLLALPLAREPAIEVRFTTWAARTDGRTVVEDDGVVTATGCAPHLP